MQVALEQAARALKARRWDDVEQAGQRIVALFPSFTEQGSGYHYLMAAATNRKQTAGSITALKGITSRDGDAVDENIVLAGLLESVRDSVGALAALERAAVVNPFDAKVQARLAELAMARKAFAVAVRARRAVLALAPADRADAFYRLAAAYAAAGDRAAARREVLRALDLAPNFEPAQDLLLSLRTPEKAP